MSDKIFFDTNVILYSYSLITDYKSMRAKGLINETNSVISTQVLQEVCNILIKKFKLEQNIILKTLTELNRNFKILINNSETINKAVDIHFRYHYSYYDSLIIASALKHECSVLYSEDLQHNQVIEKGLTKINPFT